jgi:3-hydroxyisobutyrate dehydrogenase-like beta-hydroxyacid dehydrogenase
MSEQGIDARPTVPNNKEGKDGAHSEIGFIGLGRMGSAMANNLVAAGFKVLMHTRRKERAEELAEQGFAATTNLSDLFDCEIIVSMLTDGAAVREVVLGQEALGLDGLAMGLPPRAIHLSMSTIAPATARQMAAVHAKFGQGYVAAPVLGNPVAAKARELFILAGGAPVDVDRCRPLLSAMGQATFDVGADPSAANLIKLAGNMMVASTLEIIGELAALLRKRNVDPGLVIGILTQTMFGGRAHRIYGEKIAREDYGPGNFVLPLALKDVRLALAEAEAAAVPMPSISVVRDRLIAGIARGYADFDWTALGLIAAEEAGLNARPLAAE